jgi:hypothetical protein
MDKNRKKLIKELAINACDKNDEALKKLSLENEIRIDDKNELKGTDKLNYKILNISLPDNQNEWGIIQINNFSNTYFRFELKNGKPVLDTSLFSDQVENPEEKHKRLSPESELYKGIQELLNDYMSNNG